MLADSPAMRLPTEGGWSVNGHANSRRIIFSSLRGAASAGLVTQPRDPQRLEAFHPFVDEAAADTNSARDVRDGSAL